MSLSNLRILRILTIPLAISLILVSIAGAFLQGTYERDAASMAAQGMGQDMVDLFLVVPLLLITFFYFAMVFMVILTVALAAMVIMMFVRGISEDYTLAIVFGALSIASVAMAALLFRKIVS